MHMNVNDFPMHDIVDHLAVLISHLILFYNVCAVSRKLLFKISKNSKRKPSPLISREWVAMAWILPI